MASKVQVLYKQWDKEHHCDVFEKLVKKKKILFDQPVDIKQLDETTQMLLIVINSEGYDYKMGNIVIRESVDSQAPPSRCFKISNPDKFCYIETFPITGQFMYVRDEEHTDSIHPDEMLLFFIQRRNGKDPTDRVVFSDTMGSVIETGGIKLVDTRTQADRNALAKHVKDGWYAPNTKKPHRKRN